MVNRFRSDIQVCLFCAHPDDINRLIAGPDHVFICDECVDASCREILEEDLPSNSAKQFDQSRILSPKEIYEQLNEWVVGQGPTKKFYRWPFITTTKNSAARPG
ncbi:MAG: ClpX C4-type zinc finger protein [Anaerolineae bacterium]